MQKVHDWWPTQRRDLPGFVDGSWRVQEIEGAGKKPHELLGTVIRAYDGEQNPTTEANSLSH